MIAVSTPAMGFDLYEINSGRPLGTLKDKELQVSDTPDPAGYPAPVLFIHGGCVLLGGSRVGKVYLWDIASRNVVQILRHRRKLPYFSSIGLG